MAHNTVRPLNRMQPLAGSGDVRVGRIVEVREGRPVVEFSGHRLTARVAMAGLHDVPDAALRDQPVLLVLENGDPALPIVIGLVSDTLPGRTVTATQDSFEINGRRVSFEGREEVVLRCGEASITLRADGQVLVKGSRVTSRASETNKIRGATVQIN